MDDLTRKIRDDCLRLASLIDDAEQASGPWLFIPEVARRLRGALNEALPLSAPKCANCGKDDGDWTHKPITAAEARAGLRALGFIGLHDLTPEEMKSFVSLMGKIEALGEER